ncbi:hypothetical protein G3O06_28375 [Burkholderia sp. Ac-20345]|uniref:hypothetical protein n=1 Tax=Burkholderia sp. Ac-20345 TaxID=2703891 RepID=UPI00197C0CE9|nr:hypothetical protein [Burkholderia sp. Ac-20345]
MRIFRTSITGTGIDRVMNGGRNGSQGDRLWGVRRIARAPVCSAARSWQQQRAWSSVWINLFGESSGSVNAPTVQPQASSRTGQCVRPASRLPLNAGCQDVVEERADAREPEASTEPVRRRIEFGLRKAIQQQVAALEDHPAVVAPGFSEPRLLQIAARDFEFARRQVGARHVARDGVSGWRCRESNRRIGSSCGRSDYRA